ncbi:DUF3089 domain-containing protein [Sandaracinobacteroides hominis]|uniref:DUF3089 domain-containing protein n=1 Tax=Sandaracinobacteroides hominis TaxID=2780086 RepID=UPI0018F4098A|nr:DUF3089 domain-containing protein [Sandaracinobacteroides hominis]
MRKIALTFGLLRAAPALAEPPAPDYASAANWSQAASALPAGATPAAKKPKVDVFFIHPTTYRGETELNQDVSDATANQWADASSIARQASAFTGCCRVFAPRYRQASIPALRGTPEQRDAAYALAYSDIERAFDVFLTHTKGRPFLLAGHSQGGLHVATLLEKRIDGTPLQKRLVAAYAIGFNLAEGDFGRTYKSLKPCATRTDTGCVLQWNAVLPETDLDAGATRSQAGFVAKYGDVPGKQTLCMNPVSFEAARPETPRGEALGAIPGDPGAGPLQALVAGAVAAKCDRGFLVVAPDAALALKPLPGGSLHYHDFGLFWADIRADAVRRAQAFGKR